MSKSFAAARSRPLVELAFAWLLAHPQVISVIAGATTLEQITARRSSGVRLCEGKVDAEAEAKAWPSVRQRQTEGLQYTYHLIPIETGSVGMGAHDGCCRLC